MDKDMQEATKRIMEVLTVYGQEATPNQIATSTKIPLYFTMKALDVLTNKQKIRKTEKGYIVC